MHHRILSALTLGLLAASAHAADPSATITSPGGTTFGEYTGSTTVGLGLIDTNELFFIDEQTGPLGKSWYIFFEPKGTLGLTATVTFDSAITNAFVTQTGLDSTNAAYGKAGVTYGSVDHMGLETTFNDSFSISGNTLTLNLVTSDPGDHVRVFTSAVPEPSTWALMAGGLLAIAFTARRRS